jgi:hypothetical protein
VVGRTAFHLTGEQSHTYRVSLTAVGRKLLRLRSSLKTHVLVAIPGGRRIGVVELRG